MGRPRAIAVAAIQESLTGILTPASRRATRSSAQGPGHAGVDRQRLQRLSPDQGFQTPGSRACGGSREDARPQLGDRHIGHGNSLRWVAGHRTPRLLGDEDRGVGDGPLDPGIAHPRGGSSVVSESISDSSWLKAGSARHWSASLKNSSHETHRGRCGTGVSRATGRPRRVTSNDSPASTLPRTRLTSFRSSRVGTRLTARP